jgi:hypothetical protein
MAVMTPRELRAGHEERGESIADIFGDFPGGTIFGIAQAALAGKSLLLARNVVRHAREGLAFDNNASGRQLRQRICAVDAVIVDVGTPGVDIDDNLQLRCGELYVEAVASIAATSTARIAPTTLALPAAPGKGCSAYIG